MIVWLASYPRSGNTLLRTLLHQQFGLLTFSDERGESEILGLSITAKTKIGFTDVPGEWSEYYRQAYHAHELQLIKTHRTPFDESKAIYVVRDGRSAYVSYARYHAFFVKDKPQSLLGLILGLDFYGGWSEHYRSWMQNKIKPLILRYEELVDPNQATIEKIADYLGVDCPVRRWKNPFVELNKENPNFFREGQIHWQGSNDWSELIDSIFFYLHGDLMTQLGYVNTVEIDQAIKKLTPEMKELLGINRQLVADLSTYRNICLERQIVIDKLKQACDERLTLIEMLNMKMK